ncbi:MULTISPECIES: putative bifunctional diguanylate cyclase/phosphodiesterase [Bradyrhizobium]|jgi:diguanylate cyclase (GGDEF)-like protein|uniref:putative bifunctional diguanylate cyclase/phosphodiesterase n=1 Tax=Bradyrhizobium TaxID=374 RepID=UPI0004831875|nr:MULTISPECIES: EAL domain-containing protein [Bradyrhizobium]MDI2056870.1 EAL domain-containing protein [Bradyrhizobium sp. Mp19]MDI2108853.1 EAL domain-containing protein [Bradyrhizobium sp. Mp64]WLB01347.1 EAL domain-containing protein [Bradyrhizobium elkanii]WLC07047.1 EAL domain-containing protein [Bradyrhizobium elkanii USDA 94]
MQFASQTGEPDRSMSPTISAALVDSLFMNPAPMIFGAFGPAIAGAVIAAVTSNLLCWLCVPLFIVVGLARALQMYRYQQRNSRLTVEESVTWEKRYRIGTIAYGISLGIWGVTVLLTTNDAAAHMLCVTTVVAYTSAGVGRTFGRPQIFHLHLLMSIGPLILALMYVGGPYHIALALLSLVFFSAIRHLTSSLQRIYVNAWIAKEREAALAGQFDTALNNMPHGLCMFSADGRVAVMNHRFIEMTQLSDDFVQRGASATDICNACVLSGSISAAAAQQILYEIESSQRGDIVTSDPDPTKNRSLDWTFQPMAGGGTVVLVEDITERKDAEARISHLARYDELTALPNRVNFRDEIGRLLAMQHGDHRSALLFVDLDQFKQVNDTLGHPCGDQLLCAVAERLREMLRPEDFVARFGGDEFVVFQQNIHSHEDAAALARRIVDRLSERYKIDNHLVEIGASVGIAMTAPGVGADTLLKNADMALYRAKADGRGTFCFFRDEMAQTVEARRILELDLRKALANEEFELFYQPLINLKSGKVSTCEALLRWNHPARGTVSPVDIIPVAEDMGLIVDLGRWILRKACMECMKWPEAVSVAVNFSPQQFHQRDVLSEVRYALEVSGLPAHRLEIEITESSLLHNTELTHDVLSQLRSLGVRISLDDFGTGYSSLSYLHNFPLQKVKIDRSFLEGIDSDRPLTLLRGVARLSADLGMSVVVEGIETNEQLELISADGAVTEAQGYLFSRPVPSVRIRQLLNASHGRRTDEQLHVVPSRSIA